MKSKLLILICILLCSFMLYSSKFKLHEVKENSLPNNEANKANKNIKSINSKKNTETNEHFFRDINKNLAKYLEFDLKGKEDDEKVDSCINTEWKGIQNGKLNQYLQKLKNNLLEEFKLKAVKENLKEKINTACQIKPEIMDFFAIKMKLQSYKKIFIQTKFDKESPVDPISNNLNFKLAHEQFLKLLKSETFVKVLNFLDCMKSIKNAPHSFINKVDKLNAEIRNIKRQDDGIKHFIRVLVNFICDWKNFRQALDYLEEGQKLINIKDLEKKYTLYWRFIRFIFRSMGASKTISSKF